VAGAGCAIITGGAGIIIGMPGIMRPYSATAAGTTAYLMASQGKGGSAILKNLARFQGTVLRNSHKR